MKLPQKLQDDLSKLKSIISRFFDHADDVNSQQNKQRIKNEGSGGAAQKNEANTIKLEDLKTELTQHVDALHGSIAEHLESGDAVAVIGEADENPNVPPKLRMRCKLLVVNVTPHRDNDGKTIGESYDFIGVGGDKVQNGYPEDGRDEDNDFSRYSPSANFQIYCQNPALFGTIVKGERYYVDFTLANGVLPVNAAIPADQSSAPGPIGPAGHTGPIGPVGEGTNTPTQVEPRTGETIPANADPTVSDPKHGGTFTDANKN